MMLQSAMALPMRRVPMTREGLYNILAFLKRHKATRSPRAIRFELTPDKPVAVVLEPWEQRFVLHGAPYRGPKEEKIRTWGRDRLRVLARMLPLMDGGEVYLLGTGLPSYWSVKMGELRFQLGLSGWTVNDWTGASALDQIMPPAEPSKELVENIKAAFKTKTAMRFEEICGRTNASPPVVLAGLNRLANLGQLIHDLPANLYRWRSIMPTAVSEQQMGPENAETAGAREIVANHDVFLSRDEISGTGLRLLHGEVQRRAVQLKLDRDGRIVGGKCTCSHFYTGGLKRGPCRHLQALRTVALSGVPQTTNLDAWYGQLVN
jgi:hypothetical protein